MATRVAASGAQPDQDQEAAGARAALGFVGVLFAFKLATVVLIFWHMQTMETGLLVGSTLWYWFPVLGMLVSGPLLFRWRLRRVRARREELRRAEWMIGQDQDVDDWVDLPR